MAWDGVIEIEYSWDWGASPYSNDQRGSETARLTDLRLHSGLHYGAGPYSAFVRGSGVTSGWEIDGGRKCSYGQDWSTSERHSPVDEHLNRLNIYEAPDGRMAFVSKFYLPSVTRIWVCPDGETWTQELKRFEVLDSPFCYQTAPNSEVYLNDEDPDPRHLVGSATVVLGDGSSCREEEEEHWDSLSFTVTYDLYRVPQSSRDDDGDTVADWMDNCPMHANKGQEDSDSDGVGDACNRPPFTWEVAPQSLDYDENKIMDSYRDGKWSSHLPDSMNFPVTFDGCQDSAATVQFAIDGVVYQPQCKLTTFLSEGPHEVTMQVTGGSNPGTTTKTIDVAHHLVVGLGDSFGSGETAADGEWDWEDPNCRRAAWSAQARAALSLERSDPHSTVTFLHLACSGATVDTGLLAPYPQPPGGDPVALSQVREAAELTEGWEIDAVLLSIGGNDISFSETLTTCAGTKNCPLTEWRYVPPTDMSRSDQPLHTDAMNQLGELPSRYRRVAVCLSGSVDCTATDWTRAGSLGLDDPSRVLLTEYPDLSTRVGGRGMKSPDGFTYCKNALKGLSETGDGIQDEEFAWAREVIQRGKAGTSFTYRKDRRARSDTDVELAITSNGLNTLINTGPSGFTPVPGAFSAFRGHGYCADKSWVTPMEIPYLWNGNKTGPFHPNKVGYKKWGSIIAASLEEYLGD